MSPSPVDAALAASPVVDHRLVFYLTFRMDAPGGSTPAALAQSLLAVTDDTLCSLCARQAAPAPLWSGVERAPAQHSLSPDLYPVAGRILFGDPHDAGTGHPPLQSVAVGSGQEPRAFAEGQHGGWLADLQFEVALPGDVLRLRCLGASVRIFGTGLGLLGLTLQLIDPSAGAGDSGAPIAAGRLLLALHTLSQAESRGRTPLTARPRRWQVQGEHAARAGALFMRRDDGGFDPVEIDAYGLRCERAGQVLPLFRCVSGIGASQAGGGGPAPTSGRLLLEQLQPERVVWPIDRPEGAGGTAPASQVAKGRRFIERERDRRAADAPSAANTAAARAVDLLAVPNSEASGAGTHQSLQSARPGQVFWAHRLPVDFSLVGMLRAFLPAKARPGGSSRAAEGAGWRAFSYVGARLQAGAGTPDATAIAHALAFRLSRRFDLTYRPDMTEAAKTVLSPFETVSHAVATQGAAVVVLEDGTEFLDNFLSRAFATAYRPLAEVCLHEYVHLLDLVQESAFLPSPRPSDADLQRLRRISDALTQYRLYYRYTQISHLAHHNDVLALWRLSLGLDVVLQELTLDVGEAQRVLLAHRQRSEAGRWRWFTSLGLAMAAFLSTSEAFDRWAQRDCPPEALAIAATDIQVHGAQAPLFDLLGPLRDAMPDGQALAAWQPLLDRACSATWASGPEPAASAGWRTGNTALDEALALPTDTAASDAPAQRMGNRLKQVCAATAGARDCARRASTTRNWGVWASLVAGLAALGIALTLSPGHGSSEEEPG